MNIYSFNNNEVLIWDESGQGASQTYLELFGESGGTINEMKMVDKDELIYLVYDNEETGEREWTLEPARGTKILRTTTVRKISKEIGA